MSLSRAVNDHSDEGASQTAICQFSFFSFLFFFSNINLLIVSSLQFRLHFCASLMILEGNVKGLVQMLRV